MNSPSDLVERLRTRAAIRRKIPRSEPDRISNDLEEAANLIEKLYGIIQQNRYERVDVSFRK